ncbi:MAG: MlaD family protein [Oligoflexia bacterium]|nr:MlaD family protein [Oligoflexia bacterium]
MNPAKQLENEFRVGIFVALGVGLLMAAILVLGSAENLLSRTSHYAVHLQNTEGLIVGAKVVLNGVNIGTVDQIGFDDKERDIRIRLNVSKEASAWIRTDSFAEIATQGLLGDKFISVSAGSVDKPKLPEDSVIQVQPGKSLSQFLSQGDQLMASLNNISVSLDHLLKEFEAEHRSEKFFQGMATSAKNLSEATDKLNHQMDDFKLKKIVKNIESITDKINNGTGTLGAVINDPGLYDNAKALMGEANRNRIVRNLVRQTIKEADQKAASQK